MPERTVERGIGETRWADIEDDEIVAAGIVRDGELQPGEKVEAKLVRKDGRRGVAETHDGQPLFLPAWPEGRTEGETLPLWITRAVIPERGRTKEARATSLQGQAPTPFILSEVEGGTRVLHRLSSFGWDELIDEARTGVVPFEGGLLAIVPTPAGITIDVDGDLPPRNLALRGAAASARAIRRLDLQGSILIDLPSLEGKTDRQAAADALDAVLPQPFERTSVNGFGLLQVVRPRTHASIMERVQNQPFETGALDLLRRAEREVPATAIELRAGPRIADWLHAQPAHLDELARRTGARIDLKAHGCDPLWWGDVHAVR